MKEWFQVLHSTLNVLSYNPLVGYSPIKNSLKDSLGQQSNSLKKQNKKREFRFQYSYSSFSPKTKNVCMTLCQNSEHL